MEKLTLDKAKNEALDFLYAAFGSIAGMVAMKMATNYGLNKWVVSATGFAGGLGIRMVAKNDMLKSFGTGVGIAGGLDLTKKGLDELGKSVPMFATLSESIPGFSGVEDQQYLPMSNSMNANDLRGLGAAMDANYSVISTNSLR